ncbi:MAG TPA: Type 1 glutamine amidotransferase-like domain-containing protein, partial [Thermoanaerobaculia bacterium]|nr:Type 1 glutamine amidotransferase-like domain-containing protein [Thermoanaerobaculia bacterium]
MGDLTLPLAVDCRLLVLIGGGEFSFGETEEVDRFLISRLPAGNQRVAFLPTASGSNEYATHLGNHFRRLNAEVETANVPIYRGRDVRRRRSLEQIERAGLIYIGGGVTNNLIGVLRETPAEEALRRAAANGAIIAAIGAAAS